jgi:hypothetical protein
MLFVFIFRMEDPVPGLKGCLQGGVCYVISMYACMNISHIGFTRKMTKEKVTTYAHFSPRRYVPYECVFQADGSPDFAPVRTKGTQVGCCGSYVCAPSSNGATYLWNVSDCRYAS